MTDSNNTDTPKVVASIMVAVPSLVFRTGWAFLKMKRRAHKVSKELKRHFIDGGIPSEYAQKLAQQFETDLSMHRIVRDMDIPFGGTRR